MYCLPSCCIRPLSSLLVVVAVDSMGLMIVCDVVLVVAVGWMAFRFEAVIVRISSVLVGFSMLRGFLDVLAFRFLDCLISYYFSTFNNLDFKILKY